MVGCVVFGVIRIIGICSVNCGGYSYITEGFIFVNSFNRGQFFWAWEVLIIDLDGFLIIDGFLLVVVGKMVFFSIGILLFICIVIDSLSKGFVLVVVCLSELKYYRFIFNGVFKFLEGKDVVFINVYGSLI